MTKKSNDDFKTVSNAISDDNGEMKNNYLRILHSIYNDPEVKAFIKKNNISDQDVNNASAKLYEFVDQRNKFERGEEGVVPGYAPKLIWENGRIDVAYQPTAETVKRQRNKSIEQRFHAFSMPKKISRASLSDFHTENDNNRSELWTWSIDFIERYVANRGRDINQREYLPGLYLYGNYGVGKTYLLGAIANELVSSGIPSTMVHFPSFVVDIKNSFKDNTFEQKISFIKKSEVLFLDDIGADTITPWVRDEVLGVILEYRMQNDLTTFFSSNYSMKELQNKYLAIDKDGNQDLVKAERLMQRVRYLSREYKFVGDNHRF